jgi:ATP-dependent DNA helicase RecG
VNLAELLTRPEGKTLEFKRDLSSLKPVLKSLVAFANTAGGVLIIGRTDAGDVVGVDNVLAQEERLANAIADSIYPAMTPEINIVSHAGKSLLVARVPHWRGPFYLKAEGPERGVYVRLGSTNRQAGPEILAELQRSITGLSFDQLPCPDLSADALDPARLERFFAQTGRKGDQERLETLGILTPRAGQLAPSHGGLLLFGCDAARQRAFPDAVVSCARFRGTDKVDFLDRLTLDGTILEALDDVVKFIRRNTRLAARITTMRRQDVPEYPEVALREVLVNAVAHADYSLTGMRIRVAIYADRMEIENPGMLPFGMTLDDLKAGVSRIRNRVIARVLRELGLLEEWGTGYRRVIEDCRAGGYPAPEWQELGPALRVVFWPHAAAADETANVPINVPVNVPINDRQRWFLDQVSKGIRVGAREIAAHFDVSEKTARRDIAYLQSKQLVEFVGARKTGSYRIREQS